MKVSDLLEARRENWQALEQLCSRLENRGRRQLDAPMVSEFASLYRSACADLALADAYQLPQETVHYLHQLVGRAHNQLYRSRLFNMRTWARQLLVDVPRRLFRDKALRLAFFIFWGVFLLSGSLSYVRSDFAQRVVGNEMLTQIEGMYAQPAGRDNPAFCCDRMGFYIAHNAGIGLRCFAMGLLFGVGGLLATIQNAAILGGVFGHMATTTQSDNFFRFVTAHGPYELTAVVMAAGAGMRLGFSLLDTKGQTRIASLRRAGAEAMPTMGAFLVLFSLAAMIEAFISPSSLPYAVKAGVAVFSIATLVFYFVFLGYPRDAGTAGRTAPPDTVGHLPSSPADARPEREMSQESTMPEGRRAVG
ncbi:MAG: stage II sporulation protein M [Pirellulales bacterium]|nr:stage II sporulation protein M [Pirellulales bacterium]